MQRQGNRVTFNSNKYEIFGSHISVEGDTIKLHRNGSVSFRAKEPDNTIGVDKFHHIDHEFEKDTAIQAYRFSHEVYLETIKPIVILGNTTFLGDESWSHGYKNYWLNYAGKRAVDPKPNQEVEIVTIKHKPSKSQIIEKLEEITKSGYIDKEKSEQLRIKANHLDKTEAQAEIQRLWKEYNSEKIMKAEKRLEQIKNAGLQGS